MDNITKQSFNYYAKTHDTSLWPCGDVYFRALHLFLKSLRHNLAHNYSRCDLLMAPSIGGQKAFLFFIASHAVLYKFMGYCGSTQQGLYPIFWIVPNRATLLLSCAVF